MNLTHSEGQILREDDLHDDGNIQSESSNLQTSLTKITKIPTPLTKITNSIMEENLKNLAAIPPTNAVVEKLTNLSEQKFFEQINRIVYNYRRYAKKGEQLTIKYSPQGAEVKYSSSNIPTVLPNTILISSKNTAEQTIPPYIDNTDNINTNNTNINKNQDCNIDDYMINIDYKKLLRYSKNIDGNDRMIILHFTDEELYKLNKGEYCRYLTTKNLDLVKNNIDYLRILHFVVRLQSKLEHHCAISTDTRSSRSVRLGCPKPKGRISVDSKKAKILAHIFLKHYPESIVQCLVTLSLGKLIAILDGIYKYDRRTKTQNLFAALEES